ncbi:PRD domain-containing protein [Cutibacterium avidum]|uniref:PRD domain-containing protein n=1 Tax=Cutibacterium avidum TaxID=33010 RepID=UPI0002CCDB37|nr:PRD domain-containing protein [Cutibacterium avidum]AGJ78413.1 PRD domain-containing protein [Cutibacterium avidum 44067]MCO6671674.1 PRD domain-containing protein [Cutibacterium avidum]MDU5023836.1 PRD domain-containing protein [Cutibacterium avidum]PGX69500.1 transcriptional antiterminator [Cutibacterium avidum]PGX69714.1 transcriptional antiterminator [Cutibacterium avidum]
MLPPEHPLTELGPEQVVVKKVYNNNVLLGVDRSGTEMVVNARSIGFGRHRGEIVDASSAQRYLAEGTYRTAAIASLLSNATRTQVRVAQAIVELAQEELGMSNSQRMMLPVLDHLVAAAYRAEQGVVIDFPLTWEVQQLYPDEASLGHRAVEIVDGTLGIHLQPEEWVAFALHFINRQWDGKGVSRTVTMTQAISEVFTELEELWQVKIDRSSMSASRFVTHLRYLFARAADNKQLSHIDLDIMGLMSDRYPAATSAALTVAKRISTAVGDELTKAEINYIALHTSRLYGEVMGVED